MPGVAKVLCYGIVVADRVYELDCLPTGDGKYTARAYRETGGGIAGTAAVAIAALGGHALFAGAIGDDQAGSFLRREMARLGVDLSALQIIAGARTPSAAVLVDGRGERCLIVDRGTVSPELPEKSVVEGVGSVLVDHRFPAAAMALLRSVPDRIKRVLDGEAGTADDLRALAANADYPIFSRNGLAIASGAADPAIGLGLVEAPHAVAVAVTLGAEGSLWRLDGRLHHVPAPTVAARDTTGCGDVFHGAFALAVAEGAAPLAAAEFATKAAAAKAQRGDGWHGMPGR